MAGGPNAQTVMCLTCGNRAERDSEGMETDWYSCTVCGGRFGIDWSHDGPPMQPAWPPDPEQVALVRKMAAMHGIDLPDLETDD